MSTCSTQYHSRPINLCVSEFQIFSQERINTMTSFGTVASNCVALIDRLYTVYLALVAHNSKIYILQVLLIDLSLQV